MSQPPESPTKSTVADACAAMEVMAPTALAEEWDNVGLLAGDPSAPVSRVLACVDLTRAVVDEAVRESAEFILAYHPPILKPVSSIRADGSGTEAIVFRCVQNGIAVYAVHTALDAAEGGTNDVIASFCGAIETEPIEYLDEPSENKCKLIVFVPPSDAGKVANAMFAAGAGHIGDYSRCSFRIPGEGTFFGGDTTEPAIGQRGRLERVDEIRLETVVPSKALPAVVSAMVKTHPYEEPAFDIYPLKPRPVRGIGRIGRMPRLTTLLTIVRRLKRAANVPQVQVVGPLDRKIDRVVVVVGAAGSIPFRIPLGTNDAIITGEIRHHDALRIRRTGCAAVALGHWASERPVLTPLAERLRKTLPALTVLVSTADRDPFDTA